MSQLYLIGNVIKKRNQRRGLCLSLEKLTYVRSYVHHELRRNGNKVLYVGVGHGIDVIHDLTSGVVQHAVGVDPYIDDHGNGKEDYFELVSLIKDFKLEKRLSLYRQKVQEYLPNIDERFSAIVCFDVLHHIFVTTDQLSRSILADDATRLFRDLRDKIIKGGVLIVGETQRDGIRQSLWKAGMLKSSVNYRTKQNFREWRLLIERSGFRLVSMKVYIPWALRKFRSLLDNKLGLHTVSERCISVYEAI